MSACVLTACFVPSSWMAARVQSGDDFATLFRAYRLGDAERAIETFKSWSARRVGREARLASGQDDGWSKAALALLHREAAVAGSTAWATHKERYDSLMADLLDRTPLDASELRAFCRDFLLEGPRGDNWPWLYRRFPGDPIVTLRHGKWLEYWMPRIDSTRPTEYGFMIGPVIETTSHGKFGREAPEAVATFRKALEQAPQVVEARVRLGRVLWQLDRRDEAVRELRQAMFEAAGREPMFVYLAGLFLGQVYEEQKLTDEAEQAYRSGLAAHPTGQVIPMLLGRMLVATGRDAEGWAIVSKAIAEPALSVDPWTAYFVDDKRGPEIGALLKALRMRLPRPEV
jgi:tetratricopeptide (TPR) repeat protein